MRTKGDPPPPPAHPLPPLQDSGGCHHCRLLHPQAGPRHDQHIGHRKGPKLLGGSKNIQAHPVPQTEHPRLQRKQLQVHSVWVRLEVLPLDATWALHARAGVGLSPPLPLALSPLSTLPPLTTASLTGWSMTTSPSSSRTQTGPGASRRIASIKNLLRVVVVAPRSRRRW